MHSTCLRRGRLAIADNIAFANCADQEAVQFSEGIMTGPFPRAGRRN
jgi:hypothetical protein